MCRKNSQPAKTVSAETAKNTSVAEIGSAISKFFLKYNMMPMAKG
jgi:hypothetical protein